AVILPGTKSTIADLLWLRAQGFEPLLQHLGRTGTAVVGICGGYQMLGQRIQDPLQVESPLPEVPGLGLLPLETVFAEHKATYQAEARVVGGAGWLAALQGATLHGYEIHMGHTLSPQPWLTIARHHGASQTVADGMSTDTGQIWGCYLHGLFENTSLRHAWLTSLGWVGNAASQTPAQPWQAALDALVSQVETHLDMARLEAIIWG
ncbi:MAG: cobyric acid synthase CobQ, partial [Candidatus Tectomicrobia bacterium]|nr:cobyric acid synthase CobQ [Candidatus Tectomicrobia bacterium]